MNILFVSPQWVQKNVWLLGLDMIYQDKAGKEWHLIFIYLFIFLWTKYTSHYLKLSTILESIYNIDEII